ncbi:hypothetical protein SHIRM173S_02909 [Streptomyces hirsutus]
MIAAYVSGAARFGAPPSRLIAPTVAGGARGRSGAPASPSTAQMEQQVRIAAVPQRVGGLDQQAEPQHPQVLGVVDQAVHLRPAVVERGADASGEVLGFAPGRRPRRRTRSRWRPSRCAADAHQHAEAVGLLLLGEAEVGAGGDRPGRLPGVGRFLRSAGGSCATPRGRRSRSGARRRLVRPPPRRRGARLQPQAAGGVRRERRAVDEDSASPPALTEATSASNRTSGSAGPRHPDGVDECVGETTHLLPGTHRCSASPPSATPAATSSRATAGRTAWARATPPAGPGLEVHQDQRVRPRRVHGLLR